MNILLLDSQEIMCVQQESYARNRLFFSLTRFGHRVNGATMHFSAIENSKNLKCTINVSVEGTGVVSVVRSGNSVGKAINLAVNAVEPKVAFRVDWRSWFNADTFATWIASVSQPLRWFYGICYRELYRPRQFWGASRLSQ